MSASALVTKPLLLVEIGPVALSDENFRCKEGKDTHWYTGSQWQQKCSETDDVETHVGQDRNGPFEDERSKNV